MAKLTILIAPDEILRKVACRVKTVDSRVKKLLDDMIETMEAEDGIGLAAPQVGVSERALVMNVPANIGADREEVEGMDAEPAIFKIINPEIIWKSETKTTGKEGCLSIPNQYADVVRANEIKIKYLDETGSPREKLFKNLQAVCLQHEIDHLDGKLFVDYLSPLKRSFLIGKGKKFAARRAERVS